MFIFYIKYRNIDRMSLLVMLLVFVLAFLVLSYLATFVLFFVLRMIVPYFFWGAVYVPTKEEKMKIILEFAEIKPGNRAVDLGSGDGRLVIALAQNGALVYGYEINPLLVKSSQKNISMLGLEDKAFIYGKNFWNQDLSGYDIVIIYGMTHVMEKLEKKLSKELKKNTKIISHGFVFPNWKPAKAKNNIYLYIIK